MIDLAVALADAEDRSRAIAELEELIDNGYAAVVFDGTRWTCRKQSREGEEPWKN